VLVGGLYRVPLVQETVKKFFGKEPHKGVNPDEVVAVGAAVASRVALRRRQGHGPARRDPAITRRRNVGRRHTVMKSRATPPSPTQKKEVFSTATDSQPSVEVHVLQGERTESRYNRTLGRFHLEGIMPAPRGVPKVEVTFDIDANGILSVHAKDTATGKDQRITITPTPASADTRSKTWSKEAFRARGRRTKEATRADRKRRNKLDNLLLHARKRSPKTKKEDRQAMSRRSGLHQRSRLGHREAGTTTAVKAAS